MCGLVWVVGREAARLAPKALQRLEYRGYDSFGFAWPSRDGVESFKSLDDLRSFSQSLPDSNMVLGHTRWATHGNVSLANCHPHVDPKGRFAIAHNGIATNADTKTEDGQSDTRWLATCLSGLLDQGFSPADAFQNLTLSLEGRNALVVMFASGETYAFRSGSPLVLVQLDDGYAVASDLLALAPHTRACQPLRDGDVVRYLGDQIVVNGQLPSWQVFSAGSVEAGEVSTNTPGCFMYNEILAQWQTITMPLAENRNLCHLLEGLRARGTLLVTGAGGAGIVAAQIAQFVNARTEVRALAVSACEFASYKNLARDSCLLAISQSGETADTLVAIEQAQAWGMPIFSLVNMPFTTMSAASDTAYNLGVGAEHCVLSTKSATAQLAFGYWLAANIAGSADQARRELDQLSVCLSQELEPGLFPSFYKAVSYLADQPRVFLLGRGAHYPIACLAALNLKEAAYIHAEAFSAGELKHGVIALIEEGTPVILFGLDQDLYMRNVAAELKSRGAWILAVGSESADICLPDPGAGHIVSLPISCQILAYLLARQRGLDPDRPRNLAKSVTVL